MPNQVPDREAVRAFAMSLGFDVVRFARAETNPETRAHFAEFLLRQLEGDMGWMRANADRRADPKALWPEARSVIMVGLNYARDEPNGEGAISVYARGRDYHDVLKKRLKRLAGWLAEASGAEVKLFVDTAPVMEKPLAQAAGIGWQGKHTNLVSRDFGSWLFLGEVFTTLDFEPDASEQDHCGACRRCLDICPTRAFIAPYKLDARRCISYLTIEHKGPIPRELRPLMGNHIYGCDDCLAVCPWNKFAQMSGVEEFAPHAGLASATLRALVNLDDTAFRALFAGSPVKRTGRARFARNVLIAMGNSADRGFLPDIDLRLRDESPLVRGAAVWALRRLASADEIAALRDSLLSAENDVQVQDEWNAAI